MRWVVVAVAVACGSAQAAREPVSSGNDERVKQIVYAEDDVINVRLTLGYFTRIILNPDEEVVAIHKGMSDGYAVTTTPGGVTIEPQSIQVGEEWIDPNEEWTTNFEIETNKRSYLLNLEIAAVPDYKIKMLYPAEVETARVEARDAEIAADIKAQPKPMGCINFEYEAIPHEDYSRDIVPEKVCDNGQHTFLIFDKHADLPTVYLGVGEDEAITDTDVESVRENTIRIKTTAPLFMLRVNKGRTYKAVIIKNHSYPRGGNN